MEWNLGVKDRKKCISVVVAIIVPLKCKQLTGVTRNNQNDTRDFDIKVYKIADSKPLFLTSTNKRAYKVDLLGGIIHSSSVTRCHGGVGNQSRFTV